MTNFKLKKSFVLVSIIYYMLFTVFLTGCATVYTIEPGGKKYNKGYVVKRNDVIIPEFTVDTQGRAPEDKQVAEGRFKRRRKKISYYYKKIGYFGTTAAAHTKHFFSAFLAPFRAPFEGVKYHKYENDPEYRAKIDAQDEEEERLEQERIEAIQEEMDAFIEEDLKLEQQGSD